MIKIAPSILSADFTRLGERVAEAEAAGADYIHIDVMDSYFAQYHRRSLGSAGSEADDGQSWFRGVGFHRGLAAQDTAAVENADGQGSGRGVGG